MKQFINNFADTILVYLVLFTVLASVRVVSCALFLDDVTKPYFLAQLLLRLILTNAGFSEQLDEEVDIVKELQQNHLVKYLPLLKLIMGKEVKGSLYAELFGKTKWRNI